MLLTKRPRPQLQLNNRVILARQSGQRIFANRLLITLLCLCLGMLVVACGTNGGTATGTTTGAGSTTANVMVQLCGVIHTTPRGIITDTGAAKTAEDCFAQDYKQCHPAVLNFDLLSLDTGTDRVFTIKNTNGQCSITDAVQHYVVPHQPGPAKVYTCSGMTQEADGLHFTACGQDGDIVVPDTSTPVSAS